MNLPKLLVIVAGLTCLLPMAACSGFSDDAKTKAFVEWAAANAVPIKTVEPGSGFDDLQPFRKIVGDARVVCLGESRHDAHEQFRFKHRLIEFLVEEMGFTLFALEESLPCCIPINDYILGGEGDPEKLLNSVGGWFIWDTEEVLALLKWMRAYNGRVEPGKKIRFYGIDITDPLPGLRNVVAYLEKVDPSYAASLRKEDLGRLFSPNLWSETMENYRRRPAEELDVLKEQLEKLVARFDEKRSGYMESLPCKARSSEEAFELARRQAMVVKQANDLFTTSVRGTFQEAGDVRERAMADNIRWILRREKPGERLIVWAHNFHVTRDAFDLEIPGRPPGKDMVSMTAYLSKEMGRKMVSFGFSFNRSGGIDGSSLGDRNGKGEFSEGPLPAAEEGTVDLALSKTGMPLFVLDLRSAPKEGVVRDWLMQRRTMRGQGGFTELVPGRVFDGLIFTEKINRTVPSRLAKKRFGE